MRILIDTDGWRTNIALAIAYTVRNERITINFGNGTAFTLKAEVIDGQQEAMSKEIDLLALGDKHMIDLRGHELIVAADNLGGKQ